MYLDIVLNMVTKILKRQGERSDTKASSDLRHSISKINFLGRFKVTEASAATPGSLWIYRGSLGIRTIKNPSSFYY